MENIEKYYQMVEKVIAALGVEPEMCRAKKVGQWNLQKGSAPIWVDVWETEEKFSYFQAMSPICEVPENRKLEFLEEVLDINHKLYGVGMTKFENWVYIKVIRELIGVDENELVSMFNRIGYYADEYDTYLKNKYFGETSVEKQ